MAELVKIPDGSKYVTVLGDGDGKADASIRLGGEDSVIGINKFAPHVRANKWNGKYWLDIKHEEANITTEKESLSNGVLELTVGDAVYRYSPEGDEKLKCEIEFKSRPAKNTLVFKLDFSAGTEFIYQDTLENEWKAFNAVNPGVITLEKYLATHDRPEDIVGSYAVFINKAHNEYKTGKFCHISRAKLTDAKNKSIWADWHLDLQAKTLTLVMDGAWLDNAVYPVDPDYTLGYTSVGASSANAQGTILCIYGTTAGNNGVAKSLHVAIKTSGNFHTSLYLTGGARVLNDYLAAGTGGQFTAVDVSGESYNIVQGTAYYPGAAFAAAQGFHYDSGGASDQYSRTVYTFSMPNPFGSGGTAPYRPSAYLTYGTVGGGEYTATGSFRQSGILARIASLLRTYTGIGPRFIGSLTRIAVLNRTYSGIAQILTGTITRTINLLTRSYGSVAQLFSGIVEGVKSAGAYVYTASGLQTLAGVVSHVANSFRVYGTTAQIFTGTIQRTINLLTRTYDGTAQILTGTISRRINLLTRSYSSTAQILSGTILKALNKNYEGIAYLLTGTLERIAVLERTYLGRAQIFSGVIQRAINVLTRTYTGTGQLLSGTLDRTLDLFSKTYEGTAQIFSGALSRTINLLTRTYTGTAQILSGIVTGETLSVGYSRTKTGLQTMTGAVAGFLQAVQEEVGPFVRFKDTLGVRFKDRASVIWRDRTLLIGRLTLSGVASYFRGAFQALSSVAQILTGATSRILTLLRTREGLAQILSGVASGIKESAIGYTATGLSYMAGSLTRLFTITQTYAGDLIMSGIVTVLGTNPWDMRSSISMSGSLSRSMVLGRTIRTSMRIWSQARWQPEGIKDALYYGTEL